MEKEKIREILQRRNKPVTAHFSGREGDPRESVLSAFFQELKSLGESLACRLVPGLGADHGPLPLVLTPRMFCVTKP